MRDKPSHVPVMGNDVASHVPDMGGVSKKTSLPLAGLSTSLLGTESPRTTFIYSAQQSSPPIRTNAPRDFLAAVLISQLKVEE